MKGSRHEIRGVISVGISHYPVEPDCPVTCMRAWPMDERTLFLNALEEDDPERRCAYLDFACAGNAALRDRLEALLRSHQQVDTFLEVPAIEQIVQEDQRLAFLVPSHEPGSLGRLDHYEVLEIVGWGSTGMVLKGRDTKLQRIVAIKVLKPLLAGSGTARKRSTP